MDTLSRVESMVTKEKKQKRKTYINSFALENGYNFSLFAAVIIESKHYFRSSTSEECSLSLKIYIRIVSVRNTYWIFDGKSCGKNLLPVRMSLKIIKILTNLNEHSWFNI